MDYKDLYLHYLKIPRKAILAVAVDSKEAYPKINPWEALRLGGGLALGYCDKKLVYGDVDTTKPNRKMRRFLMKTCSWNSPKGKTFILRGPPSEKYLRALRAARYADLVVNRSRSTWLYELFDREERELGETIRSRLAGLGMTDKIALHGLFADLDSMTYVLCPPSRSCTGQGVGLTVRQHSSTLPICNSSSDGKHHYVSRTWLNLTPNFLHFDDFMEEVLE